ncbi:MAG: hypothetical protein HOL01_08905 [Planctomycetaceae bacterium]|jgi:hypothetical protein|nr:hypothetical protein [Planctomycetaceae bacterium]MBT6484411.1 hypothetical protein [Planctomycetaceae bacterium]MBT6494652.1 hypothetical protein [Planctomycetaceae bacterium]
MAGEERVGVRRWAVRSGGLLTTFLVLYVLSVGPAMWWVENRGATDKQYESLDRIYWPLLKLDEQSSSFHDALYWYMGLWYNLDTRSNLPPTQNRGAGHLWIV